MERKKGPICSPGLMHCAYLHARPAFWIQALCGVFNGFRRRVRRYGWFSRTKLLCCVFKCQDTSESVVQEREREREREREISVLLCDVFRCEAENGGERRQRRSGRSPADLHLCLDAESEPSESRKKPASMRWRGSSCLLCGGMMKPDDTS